MLPNIWGICNNHYQPQCKIIKFCLKHQTFLYFYYKKSSFFFQNTIFMVGKELKSTKICVRLICSFDKSFRVFGKAINKFNV